ncbi:hypothetical protein Taro_046642 [Colocasia esculenta]|uniref:Protein NUCLEAR FUSION DEFECTIVE 6, chloroplastic/mitochondrial n=1 Tax=Colocasia esculenta TaxID=4460 RepID=A0A843X2P5_COLES|nr:hypothetical protein [Colocasia esculenta]
MLTCICRASRVLKTPPNPACYVNISHRRAQPPSPMAAAAAARSVLRSASLRSPAAKVASVGARAAARPTLRLRPSGAPGFLLRSPVEMSSFCVESLLPMHSATASALMTSMLSVSRRGRGWLVEDG